MTKGKSIFGGTENRGRPSYQFRYMIDMDGLSRRCMKLGIDSRSSLSCLIGVSHTTVGNWERYGWPEKYYLKLLEVLEYSRLQGVKHLKPERVNR